MLHRILFCTVFISYVQCADQNPQYDIKKVYRQGINVHALRMGAIRDSLRVLADRVEKQDVYAPEVASQIEKYLTLISMNDVCVESLTTIVCVFAQKGYVTEFRQIFDAIKKCNDDPRCMNEIAGTVLIKMKKQELKNRPFFSNRTTPVDPAFAEIRKIAEQHFTATQVPPKK